MTWLNGHENHSSRDFLNILFVMVSHTIDRNPSKVRGNEYCSRCLCVKKCVIWCGIRLAKSFLAEILTIFFLSWLYQIIKESIQKYQITNLAQAWCVSKGIPFCLVFGLSNLFSPRFVKYSFCQSFIK